MIMHRTIRRLSCLSITYGGKVRVEERGCGLLEVFLENTQINQSLTRFLVAIATESDGGGKMLGVIIEGGRGGRGKGGGETASVVWLQALATVVKTTLGTAET